MDREKVIKDLHDIAGFIAGRVGIEQARNFLRTIDDTVVLLKEDCHNCKLECLLQKYDELKEKYDALLKEQKWIPVTERLPKSMTNRVLVYVQHEDLIGYIGFGHFEKFKGEEMWYDLENDCQFSKRGYTVTHWMETPIPPMEGR